MSQAELRPTTRVAAYTLIVDDRAQILLVRIAPGYTPDSEGKWTLPGGGLNFGEDPAQGALRELTEETGYTGAIDGLAFVSSWTRGALPKNGLGPHHGIRIVYRAHVTGGELRHEQDESTDQAAWVPLREVDGMPLVELAELAVSHVREAQLAHAD